ncbi:MAG: YbaN family protein [Pseudomonadales bacterium]|nr:YbaN family protein [Pseudomonadales bacterium]MDG1441562.1 YbaN family protein [Pseudomonadales bacterium]
MLKDSLFKRRLYLGLGFVALALGIIGIPMPVLPTTPFLLLSAWCFARSSERWHQWLLANDTFGPVIASWEQSRCISIRTKVMAISSMVLVGGSSVVFAIDDDTYRFVALGLMAIGAIVVLRLKTCEKNTADIADQT